MSSDSIFPTPVEIVMEITMSKDRISWLIVEGDGDERLFRSRPFPTPIKIAPASGWEGVIYVLTNVVQAQVTVVGLIDRDYRDHCACQPSFANLVLSDLRDIEVMLFWSPALQRVIAEKGSPGKLPRQADGSVDLDLIRRTISATCFGLGKLRILCNMQTKPILFCGMTHAKFINDFTLTLDEETLIQHLNGRSKGKAYLSLSDWRAAQQLTWTDSSFNAPEYVCHGHDLMSTLAIALRRLWGTHGGTMDGDDITPLFRIAYTDLD
jgi:hypothetical protein